MPNKTVVLQRDLPKRKLISQTSGFASPFFSLISTLAPILILILSPES